MTIYFLAFILVVVVLLALDLGVFHRQDVVLSTKNALLWTVFWIVLGLFFNGLIYFFYEHHWLGIGTTSGLPSSGMEAAVAFFTAYMVEKSLSVDNIFVIAIIFNYFAVPAKYQHRVLFWGILGALIMRGVMIAIGIAAIGRFSFVVYILGAFLILTAIRMMVVQQDRLSPEKSLAIRLISRFFLLTKKYDGHKFFTKIEGKRAATPLFLALVLIESTDLIFAIDSIPAVLAITLDPFIVFTSNVFALLGMRSLYFVLVSLFDRFRYLKQSLVFILAFVGIKMILTHHIPIDPLASLWIILGILAIGIFASLLRALEEGYFDANKNEDSKKSHESIWRLFFLMAVLTLVGVGVLMLFIPTFGLLILAGGVLGLWAEYMVAQRFMHWAIKKSKR